MTIVNERVKILRRNLIVGIGRINVDFEDLKTSLEEAFGLVDGVLYNGVKSISDLIVGVGKINVDFEDLKTIMAERGKALMGLGHASGEKRALRAAEMAIKSPLIEDNSIEGATGILLNFTGGKDLGLMEVVEAANLIRESASEQANIIFGVVTDPSLGDEVQVTVIATGFDRVVAESYESDLAELPEAPYRQWALTFPWELRFLLAVEPDFLSEMLAAFLHTVFAWQRLQGRRLGLRGGETGSVTFTQPASPCTAGESRGAGSPRFSGD